MTPSTEKEWLECVTCETRYSVMEIRYECECGGLLGLERPRETLAGLSIARFDARRSSRRPEDLSGVWRFREAVASVPVEEIVTHPEGNTRLYERRTIAAYAGSDALWLKHEGENPTGSFKDRGMTVATTQAVRVGATSVACASTGNTSSSLAAYAAQAGLKAIVFLPEGKVALGKMSQTLAYGAICLEVRGDFDAAMRLVSEAARDLGIYLLNSKNPFRIEGQKTIVWEILQDMNWDPPEWIAVPAGNLGNTAAFGKALREAYDAGWIRHMPRLLCVQASGANPFFQSFSGGFKTRHKVSAETVATAIRIGDPVSYDKARQTIEWTNGVVLEVTDPELMAAKRVIDGAGIGCEPASACSVAGVKKAIAGGLISPKDRVVCVLTGNVLKDPDVITKAIPGVEPLPKPIPVDPTIDAVAKALETC
jgi:threonine synthase